MTKIFCFMKISQLPSHSMGNKEEKFSNVAPSWTTSKKFLKLRTLCTNTLCSTIWPTGYWRYVPLAVISTRKLDPSPELPGPSAIKRRDKLQCLSLASFSSQVGKHKTWLEKLARDERSSLLQIFVNFGRKKFYNICPRCQLHKDSTHVTYGCSKVS